MLKKLKKYMERRQTARELWSLSDRELKDIGISRSDIYSVVADM